LLKALIISQQIPPKGGKGRKVMSKEAVLEVLKRATENTSFYSQLAQDYATVLKEYDLTPQETIAIGTGDVRWIESHIGAKVDQRLMEKFFIPLLSREQW